MRGVSRSRIRLFYEFFVFCVMYIVYKFYGNDERYVIGNLQAAVQFKCNKMNIARIEDDVILILCIYVLYVHTGNRGIRHLRNNS